LLTRAGTGGYLARMNAYCLLLVVVAGCSSKSDAKPTASPAPVARPKPAAAPTSNAFMTSFAAGKTSAVDFSPADIFAWVDYSARPAGGRNAIERAICGPQTDIGLAKVRSQLDAYRAQVSQALADARVHCTTRGNATTCEARASEEGEATLTFELVDHKLVGFAKHETFMVDDTSKDEARRDRAFARLHSQPCDIPDKALETAGPDSYCCCKTPDPAPMGMLREDCKIGSGTCLAQMTDKCADEIHDLIRTDENSKRDEVEGPKY
jgi:hypothetical protein